MYNEGGLPGDLVDYRGGDHIILNRIDDNYVYVRPWDADKMAPIVEKVNREIPFIMEPEGPTAPPPDDDDDERELLHA